MGSAYQPPPFVIKEAPLDDHRPMKVRVVGAGYCGIYLGVRIPQRLRNIDLRIYEKHAGIGGTWWANRYPGCACDVPSHSYQYTFNPNPNWSAVYASAPEICDYLQSTADKFGVMRFVKLSHEVETCTWDDRSKKWLLSIKRVDTGETIEDDADVLVIARGILDEPRWPEIPGLDSFKGEIMHSAMWKQDYDFRNKRIGIIGTGSSAIQIVPQLQKVDGAHIFTFARNPTWITSPIGTTAMEKLGLDPNKFEITAEERQELASNPELWYRICKTIVADANTTHGLVDRGSELQRVTRETTRAAMRERLARRPEIADALIPTFPVNCRRNTPGPGYLEALCEDNVEFVTDPIAAATAHGLTLESGREVAPLDVLVCATGFYGEGLPPFLVRGRGGRALRDRFRPYPEAYLSMAVDGFPNLFFMLGPNGAFGTGSLSIMLEATGDYVVQCVRKLQKEDYATMEVKERRVADWSAYTDAYFARTVYSDNCRSWYKSDGGTGRRVTGLWPGTSLHAVEALRAPRWEDFEWELLDGPTGDNPLRWLGNGWSITQTLRPGGTRDEYLGDPAWYVEDTFRDVPVEGTPEDDPEFKMRPFSH